MSNDQDRDDGPPNFGSDDENTGNDSSMYVSTISPSAADISLDGGDDEEEENPFGLAPPPSRQKSSTNTTNTVESATLYPPETSAVKLDDDDDEDVFGVNKKTNNVAPSSIPASVPVSTPSSPIKQESALYENLNTSSPQSTTFNSQLSSSTPVSNNEPTTTTASKPVRKRNDDDTIEITVSDPTKVGDGMSSYMTYRITTKTNLSAFKKPEFSVSRRFSDFLGLHTKLVNKHLHLGVIVPSPPEKDSMSMAKVKISKEENIPTDFIDRRRALLERYLNRLAQNNTLIEDADVREFLEMPNDLPKSKDTQALSGAGVLRALSNISTSVSKLTMKTSEQDQWFEEKHLFLVDLQTHLKQVYNQFSTLFAQRKDAGIALKQFSTSLNHLATIEEHPSLSAALTELANIEEKVDQINNDYNYKEYSVLTELIKEYVSLIDMIHLVFYERVKIHQQWLNAEDTLKKKRETKTKLEQSPKGADKIPQAAKEIVDWEEKVVKGKEDFENISKTIKEEVEIFEETRIEDFKKGIDQYLKNLLEQQEKILQLWEDYLPEASKITV